MGANFWPLIKTWQNIHNFNLFLCVPTRKTLLFILVFFIILCYWTSIWKTILRYRAKAYRRTESIELHFYLMWYRDTLICYLLTKRCNAKKYGWLMWFISYFLLVLMVSDKKWDTFNIHLTYKMHLSQDNSRNVPYNFYVHYQWGMQ